MLNYEESKLKMSTEAFTHIYEKDVNVELLKEILSFKETCRKCIKTLKNINDIINFTILKVYASLNPHIIVSPVILLILSVMIAPTERRF